MSSSNMLPDLRKEFSASKNPAYYAAANPIQPVELDEDQQKSWEEFHGIALELSEYTERLHNQLMTYRDNPSEQSRRNVEVEAASLFKVEDASNLLEKMQNINSEKLDHLFGNQITYDHVYPLTIYIRPHSQEQWSHSALVESYERTLGPLRGEIDRLEDRLNHGDVSDIEAQDLTTRIQSLNDEAFFHAEVHREHYEHYRCWTCYTDSRFITNNLANLRKTPFTMVDEMGDVEMGGMKFGEDEGNNQSGEESSANVGGSGLQGSVDRGNNNSISPEMKMGRSSSAESSHETVSTVTKGLPGRNIGRESPGETRPVNKLNPSSNAKSGRTGSRRKAIANLLAEMYPP